MAFLFLSGKSGSLVSLFLVKLVPSHFSQTFYILMASREVPVAVDLGIMKSAVEPRMLPLRSVGIIF